MGVGFYCGGGAAFAMATLGLLLIFAGTTLAIRSTPFSNRWTIQVLGGVQVADELARKHGFINLGQVCYSNSLVPRGGARRGRPGDEATKAIGSWGIGLMQQQILSSS